MPTVEEMDSLHTVAAGHALHITITKCKEHITKPRALELRAPSDDGPGGESAAIHMTPFAASCACHNTSVLTNKRYLANEYCTKEELPLLSPCILPLDLDTAEEYFIASSSSDTIPCYYAIRQYKEIPTKQTRSIDLSFSTTDPAETLAELKPSKTSVTTKTTTSLRRRIGGRIILAAWGPALTMTTTTAEGGNYTCKGRRAKRERGLV